MGYIDGCTVIFSDGRTATDVRVRFRDNGYIRTGSAKNGYTYYPPHAIKAVSFDPEESE